MRRYRREGENRPWHIFDGQTDPDPRTGYEIETMRCGRANLGIYTYQAPDIKPGEEKCDECFSPSVYLAGPMSGLPDYNYPAFHEAARRWRAAGWRVVNPAENHGGKTDLPLSEYFRVDLPQVCSVDALAVLPGWQRSRGASIEVIVARHLSKPILDATTFDPYQETALEEAQRLVYGDREGSYGHPADDFARTGRMWGAILADWAKDPSQPISPELVGLCMVALKVSREVHAPKRDNRVDGAGYFETVDRIQNRKGRPDA